MKKVLSLTLLSLLILGFGVATQAHAQLSKKEAKEWKKRIKQLEPEQYKQVIDENKQLKSKVAGLETELDNIDTEIASKEEELAAYLSQIDDLKAEVSKAQSQQKLLRSSASRSQSSSSSASSGIDENRGVVFKVQIGAFKKVDLKKYDSSPNFGIEEKNGLKQYTIGVFAKYREADTFKNYLRQMGVKGAWVVSYRNGQRVPLKELLGKQGS